MTKFMIIWDRWQQVIEAENFEEAFEKAYDSHWGYSNLIAIIKILETD